MSSQTQKRPRTDENEDENTNTIGNTSSLSHPLPLQLPLNINPANLKSHTQAQAQAQAFYIHDQRIYDQPSARTAMGVSTNTIHATSIPPITNTTPISTSNAFQFVNGYILPPPASASASTSNNPKQKRSSKGTTRIYTAEDVRNLRAQRALRAEQANAQKADLEREEREREEREEREKERQEREKELELEAARLTAALKGIEAAGYPTLKSFFDALRRITTSGAESDLELDLESSHGSLSSHPFLESVYGLKDANNNN